MVEQPPGAAVDVRDRDTRSPGWAAEQPPADGATSGGARLHVVVSGLPSDSHTWNLVYIDLVLTGLGHTVRNLGPCVPAALLARECRRHAPDLLVLSTVNGHGVTDGLRVVRALRRRRALRDLPIVIGGSLTTSGLAGAEVGDRLLAAGASAVFVGDGALERFAGYLARLPARARC